MATKIVLSTTRQLFILRSRNATSKNYHTLWTSDKIIKSPHRDLEIPSRTIPEHIWERMETWADKKAITCGITDQFYTYHQLYKYSRNFAAKLRTQMKIQDGDVICVMMPNTLEYAVAILGALEAGAEVTTVNPVYTPHEVHRQLILSAPKILIGVEETVPILKQALVLAKQEIPIITVKGVSNSLPPGTISFQEFALADNVDYSVLKEVKRNSEDVALLPFSSGTTGLPKGVELRHRNIVVNCLQQDVDTIRHYDETTASSQDTALGVLPFYHIYGLSINLFHKLSIGMNMVVLPKFQPETFIKVMEKYDINLLCAAPPLLLFLGSYPGITEKHLKSIKTITSGAAPLPRKDIDNVLSKIKHSDNINFLQIYGMTEASPLATAMKPRTDNYSSVGEAVSSTELKVVDMNLHPLGPNETGELLIRGPQIMKGYRNNQEATKESLLEDGWYRSGDLASIDESGTVTVADRLKELIKVKGYQVAPAELENVLKEHPSVLDAAVIGVPDEKMGEIPKGFIVLKHGHDVNISEISNFVAERVAVYKRIKEIKIVNEIPKNPSGKILRRVLKDHYC